MLAFTPEVEHALSWFRATHEVTNADGRAWWTRKYLPGPGSLGDQDARLMDALDLLQQVHNALLLSSEKPAKTNDEQTDG